MNKKIDHLKKNIAKLSVIVTSGHLPHFQTLEKDGESFSTTELTDHQMIDHANALIDHLKELQREIAG